MRWILPLLVCAQVVSAQSTNLIVNGSFESPSLPVGVVHYPPAGSLGPWQTAYSQFEIWANPTPQSLAKEGSQHLEVEDGDQVVQSIPTVPNQTYRLSFWHSARPPFDNVLTVSVNSSVVQTFNEQGVSASAFQWQFFTTTFVAVGTQTTIGFSNTPITLAGNGAHIDDVRVTAVVDTDGDGLTDDYEMGFGRYQFIEGSFTWEQAKADAESRGGHLGTITSAEEHEFLRTYFTGYANGSLRPWLGASDAAQEGVWRWVTGEIWSYTRWWQGEPNNLGGSQHYLWSGHGTASSQLWDDGGNNPAGSNCYVLEFGYPTAPNKADTDGDGMPDKWEADNGLNPLNAADAALDADNDGVNNYRENKDGTNPDDPNSFKPLSKGLVAYYPFNGNVNDESGNGFHASNLGASLSQDKSSVNESAYSFDGNDYLQTPVDSNLNTVTLSAWFSSDTRSGERSIVDSDSGGPFGQSLILGYFNSDNTLDIQFHDGFYNSPWALNDSNWHHAVAVIEPSMVRLYVDGQLVGSQSYHRTSLDGSHFRIGRHNAGDPQWFKGQIDDVRIYNRALSSQEVASLYTEENYAGFALAGAATKAPFEPATAANWTSGGVEWSVDTTTTHDGADSVKAQTTDGQSTYREYTVAGPAVVDFWWKVSSEKNFDTFSYSLNGVNQETISGEVDWTYRTLTLPAGDHTIRWTYSKDDSGAIGQDAGWLDEFAVYPAEATLTVRDGVNVLKGTATVDFGSTALQGSSPSKTLTFANEGYVPLEVVISLPEGSPFFFEEGSAYELLLGRGESVEVPIFLSTDSAGTKTAQLSISAPDSVTAPPMVTLQGVLLGQKIGVAQGGNSVASGQTTDMGLAPRTLQFTISNTGNVGNLEISSITATGNFQITQQPQTSIAPQSSTSFTVLAQAVAFGSQTGGITITSNDPDTPTFSIPLSATAFAVGGEGIRSDSMATSGTGGAIGWGLASTQLPSGATGQALKTGATPNNGGSVLEFTSQTAGVVTWSWKVSTQQDFDWLLCEVDGQEVAGISTKNGVWQTQVVNVPAGATVRWVYRKDGSGSIGEDAGYLADVAFAPMSSNLSFAEWSATHGITDPNARLPRTAMSAMFAWLGGVDPSTGPDAGHYKPIIEGGRLKYRFAMSKTADGTQQIQFSSDLSSWTSRGMSQRVLSEDANRMAVEVTAPAGAGGFLRLKAQRPLFPVETVLVGDAGNASGASGYGSVAYEYKIGKYEVTLAQYTEFLNAVAKTDPYGLYSTNLNYNNNVAGIARTGNGTESDPYAYALIGSGNRPVAFVSWFDAARFCNWLHNGGTIGASTETGAYTLNGITSGDAVSRNSDAKWWIPTKDEWYKAAFYKGGGTTTGYWLYPTQSDSPPENIVGKSPNQANFRRNNIYSVTQSAEYSQFQNYLTEAGSFSGSPSAYGTFDQGGNLYEWNDLTATRSSTKGYLGGYWDRNEFFMSSSFSGDDGAFPAAENDNIGFRVGRRVQD